MSIRIVQSGGEVRVWVKVVPGASRDRIVGELGELLKIVVSKPAERGAANAAVVSLLVDALGVSRASVRIVRGETTARKEIAIAGVKPEYVRSKLCDGI
jgi:uncharacterized protein (TIGR00251 family)